MNVTGLAVQELDGAFQLVFRIVEILQKRERDEKICAINKWYELKMSIFKVLFTCVLFKYRCITFIARHSIEILKFFKILQLI